MRLLAVLVLSLVLSACSAASAPAPGPAPGRAAEPGPEPAARDAAPAGPSETPLKSEDGVTPMTEIATFATGCYWCTEAVLQRIDGVLTARSGFTGGHVPNPTYEECCSGTTGHAEAVEVTFDPARVSYDTLLDWFWRMHDPTTLNRQGFDVGTQYRSGIFWHSEAQRAAAEKSKAAAQAQFADPIVTQIAKAGPFYEADADHQNYYNSNSSQRYCRAVIAPKLNKLGLDEK